MIFDEENFPEIPETWSVVVVQDACENVPIAAKVPAKEYLAGGALPVIDQGERLIGGYADDLSLAVSSQLPVVVFGDHTRAIKFIDFPFAAGADGIKVLRPSTAFQPRLFYRLLQAVRLPNKGYARHFQHLRSSQIPLPPLPEQKRIADKLDSVLARVDACRDRLDRIPALLKRFRQSILAAATAGRLTQDWRRNQGLSEVAAYPEVRLSSVATSRLGKMLDKAKNSGDLVPYLRNVNVRWYSFDLDDVQLMKVEPSELSDLVVCEGDVLVCEGGEPGRCAIWRSRDHRFVYQKALHRVRPDTARLHPEWLVHSLKFAAETKALDALFTGTTIKHLTGVALANFAIALPSIQEQHEIVRRVETLFAFADRLEARCAAARKQAGQLTPALLAKAFRGELVPQDPADEPAAELLKRLAASRAEAPKTRRGRKAADA